jgi:hypothetical protein
MRDMLVTQLMPQKNWPDRRDEDDGLEEARRQRALEQHADRAAAVGDRLRVLARRRGTASNRIQPPTAEYAIDCHSPFAAARAAPLVSSDTCAHASKPVIVYWVSRKPAAGT